MKVPALLVSTIFFLAPLAAKGAVPASVQLSVLNPMERIQQHQAPFGKSSAAISAARNEVESFQVVVAAVGQNLRITTATISDLSGPAGAKLPADCCQIYREEYVRVRLSSPRPAVPPGLYPDPLVPLVDPYTGQPIEPLTQRQERWGEPMVTRGQAMWGVPFEVYAGQNQPLWIDIRIPKDARPGTYHGTFRVAGPGVKGEIPVQLRVWGFTLPDGPTHHNHFGSFSNLTRFFNVKRDSDEFRQLETRYCESMAEHRINPPIPGYLLPVVQSDGSLKIVPERHAALKQWIERLHVTDFEVPSAPFARLPHSTSKPGYKDIPADQRQKAQRYYREYYAYLKQNGWDKGAYLYMLDEPNLKENYEQVLVLGAMVHEAAPKLKCLVVEQTFPQDPTWPDIDPAVDIWCPLWSYIDRKSIDEKRAHGDEVWSYTALVQPAPRSHPEYAVVKDKDSPYWHIDHPVLDYRVPTWINRQYNITGLLYWGTVTTVIDPWFNPAFAHPRHFNGGGYLFYPGTPCGIAGPITCIRLKNLRDGMEDYEYFVLLEKAAGPAAVKKIVDRIAPNWWDYAKDPESILAARREMGEAIEKAGGK